MTSLFVYISLFLAIRPGECLDDQLANHADDSMVKLVNAVFVIDEWNAAVIGEARRGELIYLILSNVGSLGRYKGGAIRFPQYSRHKTNWVVSWRPLQKSIETTLLASGDVFPKTYFDIPASFDSGDSLIMLGDNQRLYKFRGPQFDGDVFQVSGMPVAVHNNKYVARIIGSGGPGDYCLEGNEPPCHWRQVDVNKLPVNLEDVDFEIFGAPSQAVIRTSYQSTYLDPSVVVFRPNEQVLRLFGQSGKCLNLVACDDFLSTVSDISFSLFEYPDESRFEKRRVALERSIRYSPSFNICVYRSFRDGRLRLFGNELPFAAFPNCHAILQFELVENDGMLCVLTSELQDNKIEFCRYSIDAQGKVVKESNWASDKLISGTLEDTKSLKSFAEQLVLFHPIAWDGKWNVLMIPWQTLDGKLNRGSSYDWYQPRIVQVPLQL